MLDENDTYDKPDNIKLELVIDVLRILFFVIGIILTFAVIMKVTTTPTDVSSPIITTMIVKNLYKDDDDYYMTVFNENTRIVYNIKVDKMDFIKYKKEDEIEVQIINNKVYLHDNTW